MGRLLRRQAASAPKVFDRFAHIAAAVVMMGQFGQMVLQPIGKQRFNRLGRTGLIKRVVSKPDDELDLK